MWSTIMSCFLKTREQLRYILLIVLLVMLGNLLFGYLWTKQRSPMLRHLLKKDDSFIGTLMVGNLSIQNQSDSGKATTKRNIVVTPPAVKNFTKPVTKSPDIRVNHTGLPLCPLIPPGLVGAIAVNMSSVGLEELEIKHPKVLPGGAYHPPNCTSRHKVAVVIPFRDRDEHLHIFLNNIHPFLQKQQLDYRIYVVEQGPDTKFNRAMLMNIGFIEAMKQDDYQCMVFHDVDLIPEDDRNIYSCPEMPRHLSVAIDVMNYKLPYVTIFGGANSIKVEHFRKVNGFSNRFWGWGGEDDEMSSRITDSRLRISRYPVNIARYKMIRHNRDKGNPVNPKRFDLIRVGRAHFESDGLNTLKYKLVALTKLKLYTLVKVIVSEQDW